MASSSSDLKKGFSNARIHEFDKGFIIVKRIEKGLKRWKLLETEIPRKQRRVAEGYRSKRLEPYKEERDGLDKQVQLDISELQSIFSDEYRNEFDRKDKKRATTGAMPNENSDRLRSAESKINQLTSLLETERKSKEEALSRLEAKNNQLENERKAHEDALVRMTIDKSYEERAKELKLKCDELEAELARLNKRLDESENEKAALKLNHKEEIWFHKEEIRKLQESLEDEKKRTVEELKRQEAKNNQFTNQLEQEKKSKENAIISLRSTESEISQIKRQLENERKSREETLSRLEARINQLTSQVETERKSKEDALLRLSSMASSKLRDNNPNIADLSDPNRPTKLSEQFSELYDNEWTDAFDELEKLLGDKEEKNIITHLRDFVVEIYSVCSELSFSKLTTIEKELVKPSVLSEDTKIPTDILKNIKDGIKSMAPKLLEKTREVVLDRLKEKYKDDPVAGCLQHHNVKRYIDKCTEVCWYMSVQDPQLVIDGSKSPDDKFDSIKHREYTKKGPYEDFVVWPALYLYKGGSMLSKGVAQGKKEMTGKQ